MSRDDSAPDAVRICEFWTAFVAHLRSRRVSEKALPWYRRHVEQFIAAHPDSRWRDVPARYFEDYLSKNDQPAHLPDWRLVQIADALRQMCCGMSRLSWCTDFDRGQCVDGVRALVNDHATVARNNGSTGLTVLVSQDSLRGGFDDTRARFAAVICVRNHSIRGEQTYWVWILRSFQFHGATRPEPPDPSFVVRISRAFGVQSQGSGED